MIYAFEADIVPFFRNLVQALQPYAQANQICLCFTSSEAVVNVVHEPYTLLQSVSHLILQVINLIPYQSRIEVRLHSLLQSGTLVIEIENNGINLIPVSGMFVRGTYPFCGHALPIGTVYRLTLPLYHQKAEESKYQNTTTGHDQLPQFYAEMRKRLRSHFIQSE